MEYIVKINIFYILTVIIGSCMAAPYSQNSPRDLNRDKTLFVKKRLGV